MKRAGSQRVNVLGKLTQKQSCYVFFDTTEHLVEIDLRQIMEKEREGRLPPEALVSCMYCM